MEALQGSEHHEVESLDVRRLLETLASESPDRSVIGGVLFDLGIDVFKSLGYPYAHIQRQRDQWRAQTDSGRHPPEGVSSEDTRYFQRMIEQLAQRREMPMVYIPGTAGFGRFEVLNEDGRIFVFPRSESSIGEVIDGRLRELFTPQQLYTLRHS
jgi:hypothetical protein